MKEIALIGANGPISSAVLSEILKEGKAVNFFSIFPERVMIDNTQLTVSRFDYADSAKTKESLNGYNTVVIANETDFENAELDDIILKYFDSTIKAVREAGVKRLVVVGAKDSNAFYRSHLDRLEGIETVYTDTEGNFAERVSEALK